MLFASQRFSSAALSSSRFSCHFFPQCPCSSVGRPWSLRGVPALAWTMVPQGCPCPGMGCSPSEVSGPPLVWKISHRTRLHPLMAASLFPKPIGSGHHALPWLPDNLARFWRMVVDPRCQLQLRPALTSLGPPPTQALLQPLGNHLTCASYSSPGCFLVKSWQDSWQTAHRSSESKTYWWPEAHGGWRRAGATGGDKQLEHVRDSLWVQPQPTVWEMGTTWDSQGGMLPMSPSDAAPRDVELERRSDMQVSWRVQPGRHGVWVAEV